VVTTGCTSSTDAIGYAMQHIQAGIQPMFLAGGSEFDDYSGDYQGLYAVARSEQSGTDRTGARLAPFSATRRPRAGEGPGCSLLEEYDHAKTRDAAYLCGTRRLRFQLRKLSPCAHEEIPQEPARAIN